MKLWQNRYAQAFAIAGYVGSVSALGVYFTSLTQGLTWQQQVSIIGTSFIMPFAALAKALPDPLHQSSQIRAENVEQMTVNPPATGSSAVNLSAAMRKVVTPPPPPVATPEPPAVNVTSRLPRAKSGRFERTGTTIVEPPPPPSPNPAVVNTTSYQPL